jgi:hypothetical protein
MRDGPPNHRRILRRVKYQVNELRSTELPDLAARYCEKYEITNANDPDP